MNFKIVIILIVNSIVCPTLNVIGQNKNSASIEGFIDGLNDQTLFLTRNRIGGGPSDTIASANSVNGRFFFNNISVNGAEFLFLKISPNLSKSSKTLFLDRSRMELSGKIADWPKEIKVSGSKSHQDYERFRKVDTSLANELQQVTKHLYQLNEKKSIALRDRRLNDTIIINNEIVETNASKKLIVSKRHNFWRTYINSNPNSFYSPFLIIRFQSQLGLEGLKAEYEKLTAVNKESFWGIQLNNEISYNTRQEQNKIGGMVSDFTSTTQDGEKLSLYEIIKKGKYTLIDFWASWCGPCISEFPNIKKAYAKYHSLGLNVIGVSNDNREESWRNAILNNNLAWYNVSDLDGNQGALSRSFGIYKLPTNFLVDSNGKILAMDIFEEELIKTLEKYLGKAD